MFNLPLQAITGLLNVASRVFCEAGDLSYLCRLYSPTSRSSPHILPEEVMWQVSQGGTYVNIFPEEFILITS